MAGTEKKQKPWVVPVVSIETRSRPIYLPRIFERKIGKMLTKKRVFDKNKKRASIKEKRGRESDESGYIYAI